MMADAAVERTGVTGRRGSRLAGAALAVLLLARGAAGASQLDPSCTVSALNRTARVAADGSWVLPNVPSTFGRLRVRATCVQNGVVRSGQSAYFTLGTREVLRVADISFDNTQAVPATLALSSPAATLSAAGQAVQLRAVVTLPDGSTLDVTPGASGTSYTTSSAATATVGRDGLVTAVQSGTVLVSATNEGALGVARLQVVLSGDSDGDGLPDDYEIAHGLDPNNPADVLADPDNDGLSIADEFALGTDPFDPDTDRDGLLDGREVDETGTNPLLRDTDGDKVSDGLEIFSGSNPLDRNSVNLPPILASLQAAPAAFTIIFNTVVGEGSRRLTVTGALIDGTVLDITGNPYGTTYSSADLSIASFGAEPGRVFAGRDGTTTITARNGTFSSSVPATVQTVSPQALSFLRLPGAANDLALEGDFAYVACGSADLQIVSVADPRTPAIAAALSLPGDAFDVRVVDDFAYVAAGAGGLQIVDVSTPTAPRRAGSANTPGSALGVAEAAGIAYVVDGRGLRIFDVANPAAPVALGSIDLPGVPRGVDVSGGLAVVAAERAGVLVLDVSNPASPRLVGLAHTRNTYSYAADVVLRGSLAYVADGANFQLGGARIVDLSVPSTPVVVGATGNAFGLNSLALERNFLLGADYYFVNGVPIFDVGALPPLFNSVLDFSRAPSFRDDNGMGVAARTGLVYMVGDRWNLHRFGTTGESALHIGRFAIFQDDDREPPTVTLTAPADGTSVRERAFLRLRANASDDIQVASVEFLVNGQPVGRDFSAPYEQLIQVPSSAGPLVIGAVASDLGDNQGRAETVRVEVLPDQRPTVRLLSPSAGVLVTGGISVPVAAEATDDHSVAKVEFFIDGALQATRTRPPYAFGFQVPLSGTTSFTVVATATDDAGQSTSSEPLVVPVQPDNPPIVTLLEPVNGARVVGGGAVRMVVGATDDLQVTEVQYLVDGVFDGSSFVPPYTHAFRLTSSADQLHLTAVAIDSANQQTTSAEVVLDVVPDPGTTVVGRVVDLAGAPVPNADVVCATVPGTADADGRFSVPGVPTVQGRVGCRASAIVNSEELAGSVPPVPPEIGGATDVGDLAIGPQLLYIAEGDPAGADLPWRLQLYDVALNRLLPWSSPFRPAGLSGLAFDDQGSLFATTMPGGGVVPSLTPGAQPRAQIAPGPVSTTSRLLRLDPDTGAVLADVGEVHDADGSGIAIRDLTFDPAAGLLYGVGGEGGGGEEIYAIDPASAAAVEIACCFFARSEGLAMGLDGLLYLLLDFGEGSGFEIIDPLTGARSSRGFNGLSRVAGLALAPGGRTFRALAESQIFEIDPTTGDLTALFTPDGNLFDALQALAYRPLARSPVVTTLTGRAIDADGLVVPDAAVSYLGADATSGVDGSFSLPDVLARTPLARVVARRDPELVFSDALPPVEGGITDLGNVVFSGSSCVRGSLFTPAACVDGPVSDELLLEVLGPLGNWDPAGTVTPDLTGSFCATLRRGLRYRLRRDEVPCSCGSTAFCEAPIELTDPNAAGICSDPAPACEDLGQITMSCDFFCGS